MPSANRSKKVLLIRNANSFDFGGAEIFPTNLALELIKNDYIPIVLSANKKTLAYARNARVDAVRSPWWSFQNFSGLRICLFPLYLFWQLYLVAWYVVFAKKQHIDVFHPQGRDDFIATTFAAKITRKKSIWSDHADLKYAFANHGVWYKNPVGKLVYFASLQADAVTIESSSEAKLISQSLGKKLPGNYSVIHIGVADRFTPVKQQNDKVVLVSTSRLVVAKGIGELIEAFKSINTAGAVLKLCGDGPDAARFKSLAAGAKNIEFLGHVDDVKEVLQHADIFIHPTYHESFGLSLVEAEMCSLPIIASNVGSIPEIVEDGVSGILVESQNAQDLAKAMQNLIQNPELRAKMGKAGRQIFLDNFQFDKIVKEKFLPIYEK